LALNGAVLFGWLVHHLHVVPGKKDPGEIGYVVLQIASYPKYVKQALIQLGMLRGSINKPASEMTDTPPQLVRNQFQDVDGFKIKGIVQAGAKSDNGFLLLSIWDNTRLQAVVNLIRIRDQKLIYEWIPEIRIDEKLHKRLVHPFLLDDGGLLFKSEMSPLERIDICGNNIWINEEYAFHHAIEQDHEGNFWVSGRNKNNSQKGHNDWFDYWEEFIIKVTPDGRIAYIEEAAELLEANGYRGLFLGVGPLNRDALHLNDIQPALFSGPYWERDDILVSLRERSTVFLFRPSTKKIIWLKTGPWLHQHDVDFLGESKVVVFGNDMIKINGRFELIDRHNHVYVSDLSTGLVSRPYSDMLRQHSVGTNAEGLQKVLSNGDVFVEETLRGRLLRISKQDLIWQFTKTVDSEFVSLPSWSRYLTENDVKDLLPILKSANCK
jgi:hypothetical protein